MLLIQQSSIFRLWTSRALMIYFRRALLFLVVSPRQYKNNNHLYLSQQQQQQKVYFSDAEDDEDILMVDNQKKFTELLFDRNENNLKNEPKQYLSNEYVFKNLSHGLNNSMRKSIDESFSDQILITKPLELYLSHSNQDLNSFLIKNRNYIRINENKVLNDFVNDSQITPFSSSKQQTPINFHNETDTFAPYDPCVNCTSSKLPNPSCPSCLPLTSIFHSFDNETSLKSSTHYSSSSIEENLSESSDNEDKRQSALVFEPNTTIINVRQLTYHPFNSNHIIHSTMTSHVCVRLIANRRDLSFPCDTKSTGCNIIKSTSILIDMPHKTLYIDL